MEDCMSVALNTDVVKNFASKNIEEDKNSSSKSKNTKTSFLNDAVAVSDLSRNLSQIDLKLSNIKKEEEKLDFYLKFNSKKAESLSLDGYFKEKEKSFEFRFSYQFQRELTINGKKVTKNYEAMLKFKSEFKQAESVKKQVIKEDIMDFVRRLVDTVVKTYNDENKVIKSISLNKEDMEELTNSKDNAKLLEAIYTLLQSIYTFQKLKDSAKNRQKEEINLFMERETTNQISFERASNFSYSMEMIINEIDSDSYD